MSQRDPQRAAVPADSPLHRLIEASDGPLLVLAVVAVALYLADLGGLVDLLDAGGAYRVLALGIDLVFLADLLLKQTALARVQRATDARIANLEGWIEANLEAPITAGQLCRIAGVSRRGLEKIFESRRGMSPMRFVTERRLAAAQRLLRAAAPGDDVTRVALGLGFNHAGRFSALYKQTYGELPSQALKRALKRRS